MFMQELVRAWGAVAGDEMIVCARERQFHSVVTNSAHDNRARTRWRTWSGTGGTRGNQRIEPKTDAIRFTSSGPDHLAALLGRAAQECFFERPPPLPLCHFLLTSWTVCLFSAVRKRALFAVAGRSAIATFAFTGTVSNQRTGTKI